MYLSFNCPEANYSPEATLLTYIFTRLFADEMNEYGKHIFRHPLIAQYMSALKSEPPEYICSVQGFF